MNPISKIFGSSNSDSDNDGDSDGDLLLPQDIPIFGGIKVPGGGGGKFASFVYMGTDVGVMARGRASMHRNGFLNVLEGCGDLTGIDVWMYMKEEHLGMDKDECETTSNNNHSCSDSTSSAAAAAIRNDAATAQEEDQGIIEEQKSPTGESISLSSEQLLSISPATTSSSMDLTPSIPYEELKHMNISSSSTSVATFGIDPAKKEMALSDNEFQQVFSMSKDTFVTLPKWKQMKMKKEVSLF